MNVLVIEDNEQTVLREWAARPAPGPSAPLAHSAFHALHVAAVARKLEDKIAQLETANRELREGESNYRQLFGANPHPMWVYDAETLGFLAVNDAAVAHYGYSLDEFLSMTIADIRPREDVPRLLQDVARLKDLKIGDTNLWRHRKKDGTLIDVEISSHALQFQDRSARMVIANDVSARVRSERRLRESEARYRQLFDCNPLPILAVDKETLGFLAVNQAAIEAYGYPREEFLAMTIADLQVPEDRARVDAELREQYARGLDEVTHRERRHVTKNGKVILANVVAQPFKLGSRRARLISVSDVTEYKRSEQALRAAEEQFRGLVEQSIAGIYIIQDDKLAYVNPRFAEIFGYTSVDELIGRDSLRLVIEKDRSVVLETRRRIEGGLRSVSYGFTAIRKDGSLIEVGVHGARATHQGRPAVIGLAQDISEKKRAEEQIQRYVEQLKSAFVSTVEVATTLSELRDPYTAGHERRVGGIAAAIGAGLGLDAQRVEGLQIAGYLHDIGKITIPAEILSKPGKLSPIEFQLIQGHPQAGYDVLKDVKFPWPVAEVALQHHERMDGSGYPQGLKGDAILLDARILAVADVVEAMSSHRPYRPGLGIAAALAEIERGRGTAYDTAVADACLKLFRQEAYAVPA